MLKSIFFLLFFSLLCNTSYSQLDSVSVSISFETDSSAVIDTLFSSEIMKANIWVNDADFVGQAMVSVYDLQSHVPVSRVKYTRQQMLDEGYITDGNNLSFPIGSLSSGGQYSIEFELQDFQLHFLAPVVISYP